MTITDNERSLLTAIRDNEFHDGEHPVGNYVWVDCLDGWSDTREFPGTMASIVKKGLAKTNGEACVLTQSGFDAINTATASPQKAADLTDAEWLSIGSVEIR